MELENKQIYLDRMRASMKEKLFWVPLINTSNLIIDFGCADGELLSQLEELNCYPQSRKIGIDKEDSFIKLAKTKVNKGVFFHSVDELLSNKDFNELFRVLSSLPDNNPIFNFSSIFHELYSFCSKEEIDKILLAATKCTYITIRDMLKPSTYLKDKPDDIFTIPPRVNLSMDHPKTFREFYKNREYESLDNYVQFLIKLMYINNWESEIKEDYFSVDWDYIDKFFKEHGFELMYKNDYSNEYVSNKINMPHLITHRELIYRKVER